MVKINQFPIYPTLLWYYTICPREVWLMVRQIVPDQHNDKIEIGRLIHENSFNREKKEIRFGSAVFDLVSTDGKKMMIAEVKKSSRYEHASTMQLAYCLYLLQKEGYEATGELRIPKEKKRIPVTLTPELTAQLEQALTEIENLIAQPLPPPVHKISFCKNCAYNEFCFS